MAQQNDLKINAGLGLRPSTIARLKQAADKAGRSKSDLAEGFILDGLARLDVIDALIAIDRDEAQRAAVSNGR